MLFRHYDLSAGEVADRKPAPAHERREQVVARTVEIDRLLRVGAAHDRIEHKQRARAADPPPEVAFQDRAVDGREVAVDVGSKHAFVAVAEPFLAGDGRVLVAPQIEMT